MLKRLVIASSLVLLPTIAHAQGVLAAAPPAPSDSQAQGPNSTIQLVWQVYLGGFNLGNVGLKSSFSGNGYSAVSKLKTAGVVNSFYEAIIDASSTGVVAGSGLLPKQYNSNTNNEKQNQKVDLTYTPAGIQLSAEPAYNVNRFPVTDDQKKGTLDPLSGIVFALSGVSKSDSKPCGDTVRVFDGRRRYDIELKFVSQEKLSSDAGYSGPAVKCTVIYKQIAGFKPNLTKGKTVPAITAWFATVDSTSGGPIKKFLVPVKIMTETAYGVALGHARKITVDGVQTSG